MSQDTTLGSFQIKKKLTTYLGLWHWSNLVIMALILLSVLLVKTLFNGKENYALIQSALEKKGVIITTDQAKTVAKLYTHKLWDWHVYFGYVLSSLLLLRVLLFFKQKESLGIKRLTLKTLKLLRSPSPMGAHVKHYYFKQFMYFLFYSDMIVMAGTGLFIKFSDDYPDLKKLRSSVKDIHNVGMYVILAFIVLHLGGMLMLEIRSNSRISAETGK